MPAPAQTFPDRPIKIIAPFTPGSPNDVVARLIAPPMSAQLGGYVQAMTPAEVVKFAQEQQATWRPIAEKVAKDMAQPGAK